MEFPGLLGIALWRLREALRNAPYATLGPFFGIIAADIAIDLQRGRLSSVSIELVIAPLIAWTVASVAQRSNAGPSGLLLFVLGAVSAFGATALLTRGVFTGSAIVIMMGLRHLTVAAYTWAAIAIEPPPRRRVVLAPVSV